MASFVTPQRRPHKPSRLIAASAADKERLSAALPTTEAPSTEHSLQRSLMPIPLVAPDAETPHAVPETFAGVMQAHVAVKQIAPARARMAGKMAAALPVQRKNVTGLPDTLKAGVEALSGIMLDDVRVHYNSPEAAGLGALAYAQGSDIHVGPGQERHLPHEAWHTVQQKQGRVRPTAQIKGAAVNDDAGLEAEADALGAAAIQMTAMPGTFNPLAYPALLVSGVVQRKPIKDWWAKEQRAFADLLAGKTDSDQMSAKELQAVIQFLENDDKGKTRAKDIKELKTQLETKSSESGGTTESETEDKPSVKSVTPEKVIEQGPKTPTRRPLPTPKVGGSNVGPPLSEMTKKTITPSVELTPPKEVEKPEPKTVGPTVKKDDEEHGRDMPKEKEGMLTVRSLPTVNAPVDGKNVFASPPEYIPISFGGKDYRLKAGQNYLNTEKSVEYKEPDAPIKGAKATLLKPTLDKVTGEAPEDVRVLGDGHHRFVWGAYRGAPVSAEAKIGRKFPEEWSVMKYMPTPEGMKMNPITDVGAVQEEFFKGWVTTDPIFVKYQKEGLAKFVEEMCKHKKLQWTAEAGRQITEYINTRLLANPDRAFDKVVAKLVSESVDKDRAKEYGSYLAKVTFARKPGIIFGPATTTGFFDTVFNLITLDPSKLSTADEMLDTLSFETQNARQRSALTDAKQKGGGEHTAAVEYVSDRKYVYEALMSVYKVTTIEALVAALGIANQYLVPVDYEETKVAGGVALPDKSVLPKQAARQALWYFKTKGWNETQRKSMWGQAPHGEGLGSSSSIYSGVK